MKDLLKEHKRIMAHYKNKYVINTRKSPDDIAAKIADSFITQGRIQRKIRRMS